MTKIWYNKKVLIFNDFPVEQLHAYEKPPVKNTLESNQQETLDNFSQFINVLQSWENSPEKKEYIFQHILKVAQIQSQYESQNHQLQQQIREFIFSSLNNNLWETVWEHNIKKFDVDKNNTIDTTEANNFAGKLWKSIGQIIVLWGVNEFKKVHDESASKSGFSNLDKYLADKVNISQLFWEKSLTQNFIQSQGNISEHELQQMKERKMNVFDGNSRKELWILLANDIGSGVEEILKFLWNIPSGIILLNRYGWYRMDAFSNDPLVRMTAEIKREELVWENPSLMLLELLWEKWLEMLKQLWEMLKSGKQWDIATLLVSLAWLLAGWAGAARLWINLSRKLAVSQARKWWATLPKALRNTMKTVSEKVGTFGHNVWKIDDLVAWAGIWHLSWAYNVPGTANLEKIKEPSKPSKLSNQSNYSQEVILNSDWYNRWESGLPNKVLRESWLPTLDAHQLQVVTDVHLFLSKWIYQNTPEDLLKMTRLLRQADISPQQVRVLMEKWITGEFKFWPDFIHQVKDIESKIAFSDLPDYLDNFSGKELSIEQLTAVINTNPTEFSKYSSFIEYLDLYDIKAPSKELFDIALNGKNALHLQELIQNPSKILAEDILQFAQSENKIDEIMTVFMKSGDKNQIAKVFDQLLHSNMSLPTSMLSPQSLSQILSSNTVPKNHLAKFIISVVDAKTPGESLKIVEAFLKTENGKWLFTSDYLSKIEAQIGMKLSNSGNILENLVWKNLWVEDIQAIMKQYGTGFTSYEKFAEFVEANDLKAPTRETFEAGKIIFDDWVFKTKLEKPYTITPEDIVYFHKNGKDINQLFYIFVSHGDEVKIWDFFQKVKESRLDFDISQLSNTALKWIFVSQKVDKAHMARFISDFVQLDITSSKVSVLKKFLESQLAEKLFTSDYRQQMLTTLNNKFVW